jgi:hypothetical protein
LEIDFFFQQVTQASWLALPFWGGMGEASFEFKTFLGNNFVI